MYDEQIQRGRDYGVLQPAIVIQILDFVHITSTERFHTSYHVVEDQMDKNRHTIQQAIQDPLQKWLLFLSAQRDAVFRKELEAITVSDTTMEKAFNLWEAISKDPENWAAYVNRDMAIRDMNQMKREGHEAGLEEGRRKGVQQGHKDVARKMLKKGMDIKDIAELTGLPIEVIQEIAKEV